MQKLQTVNAETLLYEPLEKPSFVVDNLIISKSVYHFQDNGIYNFSQNYYFS